MYVCESMYVCINYVCMWLGMSVCLKRTDRHVCMSANIYTHKHTHKKAHAHTTSFLPATCTHAGRGNIVSHVVSACTIRDTPQTYYVTLTFRITHTVHIQHTCHSTSCPSVYFPTTITMTTRRPSVVLRRRSLYGRPIFTCATPRQRKIKRK